MVPQVELFSFIFFGGIEKLKDTFQNDLTSIFFVFVVFYFSSNWTLCKKVSQLVRVSLLIGSESLLHKYVRGSSSQSSQNVDDDLSLTRTPFLCLLSDGKS